jgi:hypothetical protein
MSELSKNQILQGIEDLALEKLKWESVTVILDGAIAGMIIGVPQFVDMMSTAANGKSDIPREEMN